MKFEHGGYYIGTIRFRETFNGKPLQLKPGVKEALDGRKMAFSYCWTCDDDEKFAGECAMEPHISTPDSEDRALFRELKICWVPSGDIEWEGRLLSNKEMEELFNDGKGISYEPEQTPISSTGAGEVVE